MTSRAGGILRDETAEKLYPALRDAARAGPD